MDSDTVTVLLLISFQLLLAILTSCWQSSLQCWRIPSSVNCAPAFACGVSLTSALLRCCAYFPRAHTTSLTPRRLSALSSCAVDRGPVAATVERAVAPGQRARRGTVLCLLPLPFFETWILASWITSLPRLLALPFFPAHGSRFPLHTSLLIWASVCFSPSSGQSIVIVVMISSASTPRLFAASRARWRPPRATRARSCRSV